MANGLDIPPDFRFRIPNVQRISEVIFSADSRMLAIRSQSFVALYSVNDLLMKNRNAKWSSDNVEAIHFDSDNTKLMTFNKGIVSQVDLKTLKQTTFERRDRGVFFFPTRRYLNFSTSGKYVLSESQKFLGQRKLTTVGTGGSYESLLRPFNNDIDQAIHSDFGIISPNEQNMYAQPSRPLQ